jgi:deoxyribose-phosphate aldolase
MYKDAEWTSIIGDAEKNISISQISHSPSLVDGSPASIAQYIDHTQLKLDATEAQIDELCKEAQQYGFAVLRYREYFPAHCSLI